MDTVIAGAILADVGKLLEYELGPDGRSRQSERGQALRILLPASRWPLHRVCQTPFATSIARTPRRATW